MNKINILSQKQNAKSDIKTEHQFLKLGMIILLIFVVVYFILYLFIHNYNLQQVQMFF